MADIVYRVVVRRGLDTQALDALARFGATYISGHGGPGYESSSILVHADSEEQAHDKIEAALGEHAFISEARAMPVYVYAPVLPEARHAFELAPGTTSVSAAWSRTRQLAKSRSTSSLRRATSTAP